MFWFSLGLKRGWKPQTCMAFCGGSCTAFKLRNIAWLLPRATPAPASWGCLLVTPTSPSPCTKNEMLGRDQKEARASQLRSFLLWQQHLSCYSCSSPSLSMKLLSNQLIPKWSGDVSRWEESWGKLERSFYYQRSFDLFKGFAALKAIRKQSVIQTAHRMIARFSGSEGWVGEQGLCVWKVKRKYWVPCSQVIILQPKFSYF